MSNRHAFGLGCLCGFLAWGLLTSWTGCPIMASTKDRLVWLPGRQRTAVVLEDTGRGWFSLRTTDGGTVTGELMKFNVDERIAQVGTTAPAGWRIGGR